jgi:ABC-type multidrug transport system fused ATPase/permease subunit
MYPQIELDDFGNEIEGSANATIDAAVRETSIWFLIIGGGAWLAGYLQMYCWSASAERVAKRIRTKYLESILFQEVSIPSFNLYKVAWFDNKDTGDLTTRLIADIAVIQDGTGDKVGLVMQFGTTFLGGFALAFYRGWKLALVLVAAFPILGVSSFFMAKVLANGTSANATWYAEAGSIAQQAISNIRTVISFNGQSKEIAKYKIKIEEAVRSSIAYYISGASRD